MEGFMPNRHGVVEHYYRVCDCNWQYFNICREEGPPSILATILCEVGTNGPC